MKSSEETKLPDPPRDHGLIGTPATPDRTPPRPVFPPSLAGRVFTFHGSESFEERQRKYGIWRMRALRDFTMGWGRYVKVGDTFQVDGLIAARACELGNAVFDDPQMKEQLEILEKARKITSTVDPRKMPENFPQTPPPEPQRRGRVW